MIEIDTTKKNVYAADINNNNLFRFDYAGNLLDSLHLPSPPTAMKIGDDYFDITLSGILHPNNESKGEIVRYSNITDLARVKQKVLFDSLIRPVTSLSYDFNYDGLEDYLVGEYGNDIGRLAIYFASNDGSYQSYILENIPGAIMVKTHDFNKDGFMDIAALYAQGDEKIMIYYNDGQGNFRSGFTRVARFPAVYGSMYIDLQDFNQDGYMDIIYVHGDNFDYSQILKPYHGIRILENDGNNSFSEKYFFPIYGAAKVEVSDYDLDGDLDIVVAANFGDMEHHPERGIMYLENRGEYKFYPYSFIAAAQNQWNTMDIVDVDADGDVDVVIGAMNLGNILKVQRNNMRDKVEVDKTGLVILRNNTY
jgi:hypothetical protein